MGNVTAMITQESAKISCNFEQVQKAIEGKLAEYEGAVFTEDSKAAAKKEVASLRAEQKSFRDNLRDEKNEYMKPWNEFESRAKELIAMYDKPINLINGQIQAFEEKRVAEKEDLVKGIYEELVSEELSAYIPLPRIYNPKWKNATFKEKDIRKEISEIAGRTQKDVAAIRDSGSEAADAALSMYRHDLDFAGAMAYINNYERQRQEILEKERERARKEEAERIRREEREKMLAEQRAREEKEAAVRQAEREKQESLRRAEEEKATAVARAKEEAVREIVEELTPDASCETNLYEYRVSLSEDAKEKLEMYMDSVGIEWEMI